MFVTPARHRKRQNTAKNKACHVEFLLTHMISHHQCDSATQGIAHEGTERLVSRVLIFY